MIHSAYIHKNNNDIIRYLEKLGITKLECNSEDKYTVIYFENDIPNFRTVKDFVEVTCFVDPEIAINCSDNIDMFLAIAAIREDIDYMQWFTNSTSWILCTDDTFVYNGYNNDYKKASLTEVIDHFKNAVHILVSQDYETINDVFIFQSYNDCVDFIYNEINNRAQLMPLCTKEEIDKELRRTNWCGGYNYFCKKFNKI